MSRNFSTFLRVVDISPSRKAALQGSELLKASKKSQVTAGACIAANLLDVRGCFFFSSSDLWGGNFAEREDFSDDIRHEIMIQYDTAQVISQHQVMTVV
mmetsp:Transcript_12125/g.20268  ORF Transcript_12125/g.20268 Transcript_12125/m.20268 type:complete len:99 (-) Transcript_12125:57-353(-)